jgi:hypothetical protein
LNGAIHRAGLTNSRCRNVRLTGRGVGRFHAEPVIMSDR